MLKINEFFYRLQGKDDFVQKNHFHNEIELIYVVSGEGTLLKNNKSYSFGKNSFFIIDARNAHIVHPDSKDCSDYIRNKIVINADSFDDFCNSLNLSSVVKELFFSAPVQVFNVVKIDKIFKKCVQLLNGGSAEKIGFAHSSVIELIELLYEYSKSNKNTVKNSTLQKILDIIEEKNGNTNLKEISEKLYMNKYYISHMFKEKTGINISTYISEKIYERARELLINSTYSVEEISFSCGFSSAASFSRFFKNKSGVAPMKFRK